MELKLHSQDIELIVNSIMARLQPLLAHTDEIFDADGLSAYLKIKKSKIYELTHLQAIPFFKVGVGLRFRKTEIDLWVARHRIPEREE